MKKDPTKVQEKRNKILPSRSKEGKFMKIFKIFKFSYYISYRILRYSAYKAKSFKDMSLTIRNHTIIKVVQVSHHHGDVRYGASSGIQCSCMSLISVSWTLFKSPGLLNKFDLDCILGKGDQLSKFIDNLLKI